MPLPSRARSKISPESAPTVVCFGEILWDFLPEGAFPGGAPFNVAYHLAQQGVQAHVASAVGRDLLGDELVARAQGWGVATEGIARLKDFPTGYVRAQLNARGDAHYDITRDVAWDRIPLSTATRREAAHAGAVVFGSLAQRSPANRASLERLLATVPDAALRVFDVNLRPPYDDLALVRRLAQSATVLKLNDTEAARLAGDESSGASGGQAAIARIEAHAHAIAAETGCPLVVITGGAHGAGLLHHGQWLWERGRAVKVTDTVGAGDAFLAALVTHLLRGRDSAKTVLARACRLGEWVASQRGATPKYGPKTPR